MVENGRRRPITWEGREERTTWRSSSGGEGREATIEKSRVEGSGGQEIRRGGKSQPGADRRVMGGRGDNVEWQGFRRIGARRNFIYM